MNQYEYARYGYLTRAKPSYIETKNYSIEAMEELDSEQESEADESV